MLPLVFIRLIFQNERSSFEEKIPFHEKKKKKKCCSIFMGKYASLTWKQLYTSQESNCTLTLEVYLNIKMITKFMLRNSCVPYPMPFQYKNLQLDSLCWKYWKKNSTVLTFCGFQEVKYNLTFVFMHWFFGYFHIKNSYFKNLLTFNNIQLLSGNTYKANSVHLFFLW